VDECCKPLLLTVPKVLARGSKGRSTARHTPPPPNLACCAFATCSGAEWNATLKYSVSTWHQGLNIVHISAQLERFVWDGGARRGCVAHVKGVFRLCRVFLCVRHGSS